jgi:transposase InsO family protein
MSQAMDRPRRKRLSWESRCEIVALIEAGVSPPLAAARGGASRATGYRLWRRYQQGGWQALRDRPSTPRRQPRRLPDELEQRILVARRQTSYGPVRLAGLCPHPPSTIGKVLCRHGLSRLPRSPRGPRCVRRYERERPGELLHVDTKKLGRFWIEGKRIHGDLVRRNRGAGWQALHVAIDDHSRWLYAEVLPSERAEHCAAFLRRAVAAFAERGIRTERVLSDNARTYHGNLWRETCAELEIARRYIRPYTPRTNGKAERAIQTLLNEWAYGRSYRSSDHRTRALSSYLRWYNHRRPHSSLGNRPPISRVSHLCGHDT